MRDADVARISSRISPQRSPLSPQSGNFSERLLLGLMLDERAVISPSKAKGDIPAEIQPPSLLVGLHLTNALPDAITLGLSECRCNRQEQLADPVAGNVAAEIE